MRLVTSDAENRSNVESLDQAHLRRLAMQLVIQLPVGHEEAMAVLGYAQELVVSYMGRAEPPQT